MHALTEPFSSVYATKAYIANAKLKEIINFIILRSREETDTRPLNHSEQIKDILSKFCTPVNGSPLNYIYHYEDNDDGTIWCSYTCLSAYVVSLVDPDVVFTSGQSYTLQTILAEKQADLIEELKDQKLLNTQTLLSLNLGQQLEELRSMVKVYKENSMKNPLNKKTLKSLCSIIPLSNATCRLRKQDHTIIDFVITSPFYTHKSAPFILPWDRIIPAILHVADADGLYQHLGYSKQQRKSISKQVTMFIYTAPHHEKKTRKNASELWESVTLKPYYFTWNKKAVSNKLPAGLFVMISSISFLSAIFPYLVEEDHVALRVSIQSLLIAGSMIVPYLGNQWKSWIDKKQSFFPQLGSSHKTYAKPYKKLNDRSHFETIAFSKLAISTSRKKPPACDHTLNINHYIGKPRQMLSFFSTSKRHNPKEPPTIASTHHSSEADLDLELGI